MVTASSVWRRSGLVFFMTHALVSFTLGYVVFPRFESLIEPPPGPPAYQPVIVWLAYVVYFPVISWAARAGINGFSRPGLLFILVNSALVAAFVASLVALAFRYGRRAVA